MNAWYCWTLTYILMIMATVGMRVDRQPAAAEVGGGRSIPGGSAGPIRSVERPAAGHRSVVQGPSEERSYRIVSYRHVRDGSNRVIDGVGGSAVVGWKVGWGVWGWM